MNEEDQRRMLGAFVRARREGLAAPSGGRRRRTPGLRREELAERAGIGATWLTWIEQGRDVRPSADALDRLSSALTLTPAERSYLFAMARRGDPAHRQPLAEDAPAALAALVRALDSPAYILDPAWNVCGANDAARSLFDGLFAADGVPNLLSYVFIHPAARMLLPDWEERAARILGEFRRDFGQSINDPRAMAVVEGLQEKSAVFRRLWAGQDVRLRDGGARCFCHPVHGTVQFVQHCVADQERGDFRAVFLEPCNLQQEPSSAGK